MPGTGRGRRGFGDDQHDDPVAEQAVLDPAEPGARRFCTRSARHFVGVRELRRGNCVGDRKKLGIVAQ
jgi:hypothetical protein